MADTLQNGDRFRRAFVLLLVLSVSAAFVWMIQSFLMTIVLAAILAGLCYPLYSWILRRVRGRGWVAASATVLIALVVIVVPLILVLGLVASEAVRLSQSVAPKVGEIVNHPNRLPSQLE
jgi:predicted PurR-regulated permease PerM